MKLVGSAAARATDPWAVRQLNRSVCHLAGGIEEFGFFGVARLLIVDCALVAVGS